MNNEGRERRIFSIAGAITGWFAVLLQLYLIIANRTAPLPETLIRFFSYFTILTNMVVATYFTSRLAGRENRLRRFFSTASSSTAIVVYITVVGLVYQVLLRHLWSPEGWQFVADELLHSVIPLFTIVFWWVVVPEKRDVQWKSIPSWLVYPVCYLIFILISGRLSGFYPYPFVDARLLGYEAVTFNCLGLLLAFMVLASLFIAAARLSGNRKSI